MKRVARYSEAENLRDAIALASLMRTLDAMTKPTLARVQGSAFGGGVGLVACCDIAVASAEAAFSLSEVRLGLIPAVISPYVIAAIGSRNARRYFLTAERFDAPRGSAHRARAHAWWTTRNSMQRSLGILDELLKCGPKAIAAAKDLIAHVAHRPQTSCWPRRPPRASPDSRQPRRGRRALPLSSTSDPRAGPRTKP